MKKKLFCLALCLLALLPALSGCAGSKDPVKLTMWHNYGGDMQQTMDRLIDQFNATVGAEEGIVIEVTAISSSSELDSSLAMIADGDPGAPDMPDIFTGYPKMAVRFQEKGMLSELGQYFTADELSAYVDAFVEEGRLSDGGLYVFPVAKSTEIMFVNQTLFDAFAAETGADSALLGTFEGIARLSQLYYDWSGGKQFFTADSWFNAAEVGMVQLGGSLFEESGGLQLDDPSFRHIFETFYLPATQGGFAVYGGYSSDLAKTGDIVCSTGSSAGILFYGDTITYSDGTSLEVEYSILPYPVFEGGERWALQRGGGLMVAKTGSERERAAAEFIKWLTAPEQNMAFISQTGYLPVTKQAFEHDLPERLGEMEHPQIQKMLTAVLSMYEEYSFFTAPNFAEFDTLSDRYETQFMRQMEAGQDAFESGTPIPAAEALAGLTD